LGAPVPLPLVPHGIYWKHSLKSRDWRIAKTVTTCGNPVLQSNWAMLFVVHVPMPVAAPHALEIAQIAGIIAAGSATPQLTAHKVTAQGGPLCTAISGSFGLNLDCGDFISFSKDTNANTVMTQPTLGDYVAAILSTGFSFLYAWGLSKLIGKAFPVPDKIAKDITQKALEMIILNLVRQAQASVAVAVVQTLLDLVNAKAEDGSWAGDPGAVAISKGTAVVQKLVDGEPL
jgi:hypothetical protein